MNITVPFALAGAIIVSAGPTIERLAAKPAIVKLPERVTIVPKAMPTIQKYEPVPYKELGDVRLPWSAQVLRDTSIRVLKEKREDGCDTGRRKGQRGRERRCR
jgi:hypothetical protein